MARQRHLSRAPITEALIDIRVTLPSESREVASLDGLTDKYRRDYPEKKTIHEVQYKFDFAASEKDERTSTELGFRYTNAANNQVIQATRSGLTFSRLAPYEEWSKLRDEARKVWDIYSDHVSPENITRVAVRFINKLNLPSPLVDFDQYLNYVPRVPTALPQFLGGFFSRIVVPDDKAECVSIITQSFQPDPKPSEIYVFLDIDTFRQKVIVDYDEAWQALEKLRSFKNLIFFDNITEECARLYE
jgi:uncharacterized protein (TIGR04255 family)